MQVPYQTCYFRYFGPDASIDVVAGAETQTFLHSTGPGNNAAPANSQALADAITTAPSAGGLYWNVFGWGPPTKPSR